MICKDFSAVRWMAGTQSTSVRFAPCRITSEVDSNDLDKFRDRIKANFMRHFIIPEALKILRQVISVESNQIIPPFSPFRSNCDDTQGDRPNISIRSNFHKTGLQADFLLYVGVVNKPQESFLAYATFCVLGRRAGRLTGRSRHRPTSRRLCGVQRAFRRLQRRGL